MDKIPITRRMLVGGLQNRIRVKEIVRHNQEVDKFNLAVLNKAKRLKENNGLKTLSAEDDEDMQILKEPKLRRVRSYRGWT